MKIRLTFLCGKFWDVWGIYRRESGVGLVLRLGLIKLMGQLRKESGFGLFAGYKLVKKGS